MKRTFLAKRNALLSSAGLSWGACALLVAVLALFVRLLAPNFFWRASAPVFRGADILAARSHALISSFNDTARLTLENERLASEYAALANEHRALLQKAAGQDALNKTSGIRAGVVARPPESPYDTLTLAAGSNAGVAKGMEAFGPGGVPLGVVSAVLADFSRVTLFSAPGVATSGWVGSAALPLTILGKGAGAMQASLSRSANIAVGDVVFVPGPGMLPVGSVAHIDSNPSEPGVTLLIMPALNLFSLSWVELRDTGRTAFMSATSTQL